MLKKAFGIALLLSSLLVAGCSDDDQSFSFSNSNNQNQNNNNNNNNNQGTTVQQRLATAKSLIATGNQDSYVAARDQLAIALTQIGDATANEADQIRYFYALTRVIALFNLKNSTSQQIARTTAFKNLGDVLTAFGFDTAHRANFLDLRPPTTFPSTSPTGDDLRDYVNQTVKDELEGAIGSLSQVSSSFQVTYTINFNYNGGPALTRQVTSDAGDVLAIRAAFRTMLATTLEIGSYDAGGATAPFLNSQSKTAQSFFAMNPTAGNQSSTDNLVEVQSQLGSAIDDINAAAAAIQTRSPGGNHLVSVTDPSGVVNFITHSATYKNALTHSTTTHAGDGSTATLNLPNYFANGLGLRQFLPTFNGNAVASLFHGTPFGNVFSGYQTGTRSDPNFDGNANNIPDILERL